MDFFHYFLVIVVIGLIAYFQVKIFKKTLIKIREFKAIFPSDISAFKTKKTSYFEDSTDNNSLFTESFDNSEQITQIVGLTDNKILKKILLSLNTYLSKNKGAVSDFHLIKDIVERNCDAEEDEITEQQPIPLYLGLMGTMLGIIIGIGFLVFTGGLEALIDGNDMVDSGQGSIYTLMGAIAVAMIASFLGILFTTIISWQSKNAKGIHENHKNEFYSWIQTELLPILSGNTSSALFALQNNLQLFNKSFSDNLSKMDTVLSTVNSSYNEQVELIKLIDEIDVKQISRANINVLKELQASIAQIEQFNKYLHSTTDYVNKINVLNDNINQHLNRTALIEKMGEFFEKEIIQIEQREVYLRSAVVNVDNTLSKSVDDLKSNSTKNFNDLLAYTIEKNDKFKKAIEEQDKLLKERLFEGSEFLLEIKNLTSLKNSLDSLTIENKEQNNKLDGIYTGISKLIEKIENGVLSKGNTFANESVLQKVPEFPKGSQIAVIGLLLLIFAMLGIQTFKPNTINNKNITDSPTIDSTAIIGIKDSSRNEKVVVNSLKLKTPYKLKNE